MVGISWFLKKKFPLGKYTKFYYTHSTRPSYTIPIAAWEISRNKYSKMITLNLLILFIWIAITTSCGSLHIRRNEASEVLSTQQYWGRDFSHLQSIDKSWYKMFF